MISLTIALFLAAADLRNVSSSEPGEAIIARNAIVRDESGRRLGTVYRLHRDGTVSIIVGERLVRVPLASLSVTSGEIRTGLTRKDLRR